MVSCNCQVPPFVIAFKITSPSSLFRQLAIEKDSDLQGGFVFSKRCFNRKAYNKAVKASNLVDFTFHDLRHCAINNLRLAGNDHFVIKRASGHKTDSAFQRYNLVTEEEMKGMKWLDEKEEKSGTMDTYMDTMLKLKRT